MPYRLSALAERDLEEIWSCVAQDASPTTADRLIDAISIDSSFSWNDLARVATGPSSAKAFGARPRRARRWRAR
jgi:hypothetical protein